MPARALFTRLAAEIARIPLADSHEHLEQEPARLAAGDNCLGQVLAHYASSDLVSAGMPPADLETIRDASQPLEPRLDLLASWWPAIANTSYARALILAARDLYGVTLNDKASWRRLCRRFAETNKPGWYYHVMKEAAGVEVSLLDEPAEADPTYFVPIARLDHIIAARTRTPVAAAHRHEKQNNLECIEARTGVAVHTLDDLLTALQVEFRLALRVGAVGIKCGLAYHRTLDFARVTRHDAEQVFDRIFAGRGEGPGWQEARPLQDYLFHRVVQGCLEHRLPLQIHTGIQEGNGNDIRNANPAHLIPVIMEYPGVRFDLFHAGYPFTGELAVMAKNFPNVYPDLAWMHVINQAEARRILHEWLDGVPANKIFGFGGDYRFIEGVYGHALIARENTAWVLAEKVEAGHYSEEQALGIARLILRDNLFRVYDLENKWQFNPRSEAPGAAARAKRGSHGKA